MNRKTYISELKKVIEKFGYTYEQVDYKTKQLVYVPTISTDKLVNILEKTKLPNLKVELIEVKPDFVEKHNGNYYIKVTEKNLDKKSCLDIILDDKPFKLRKKVFTSNVELIDETEFKNILKKEVNDLKNEQTDILTDLLESFDLYTYLELSEDFDNDILFEKLKVDKKSNDSIETKDYILENTHFNLEICSSEDCSLEFIKSLKDKVDRLYEISKKIDSTNID